MTRVVYKYRLEDWDREIELPIGSEVVHFAMQHKMPTVWVEQTKGLATTEVKRFKVFGTGHVLPTRAWHVMSLIDGSFVWHLYEVEV